ncbi:MAG: TonB family protein [Ignavibacteria bacterium]|nr:TonB family protein [Ignavibacteria bacterium]MCC7158628.1 TonB family protein [Ignavibacteria bacterium]
MNDNIILINNDGYGAPELKKLSQGFTMKGFIVAVTIHIALVASYMIFAYLNEAKAKDIPKNNREVIRFVELEAPPSLDETEIPPVKQDEVVQKVKDLSSLQPIPVRKDIADDVVLKTQDQLDNITGNVSREGDSVVIANTNDIKIDNTIITDKIDKLPQDPVKDVYTLSEVDVIPECINLSQVKSMMNYPTLAQEIGLEGKVTVKVLVGADGSVLKIGSLTGPDAFYDEVKDKAMNLNFTPGLQSNKPVKVWVTVPFSFKLK